MCVYIYTPAYMYCVNTHICIGQAWFLPSTVGLALQPSYKQFHDGIAKGPREEVAWRFRGLGNPKGSQYPNTGCLWLEC